MNKMKVELEEDNVEFQGEGVVDIMLCDYWCPWCWWCTVLTFKEEFILNEDNRDEIGGGGHCRCCWASNSQTKSDNLLYLFDLSSIASSEIIWKKFAHSQKINERLDKNRLTMHAFENGRNIWKWIYTSTHPFQRWDFLEYEKI